MSERKRNGASAPTVKVGVGTPSHPGPERVVDSKGDVGFKGGDRPDRAPGNDSSSTASAPARGTPVVRDPDQAGTLTTVPG